MRDYSKTFMGIAKQETKNTAKEVLTDNLENPEVLSKTIQSVGLGIALGIGNGLLTMDDPIQKQSISKI